mmetsp:Transcript_7360/g.11162  ORF Transcript_7360/g.11162 Transcript_7360/m.11162 type:complete len:622 (-) Transcript_7360:97-1962(-)|eukprot:CAMPEP_0195300864 /NCGR_PEP_ID=MMETSP0707-20130614/28297_1 /TAXON_ID=33640 /ORGANISM="Asterionellopsis glacialis, Strain CCMP134" /LENGTH=621 /DNA_ID=CAMNT_0040363679 /DNA_START=219 /DNA_END=2084 /DNA_ORIENTATION=+
MSEETVEAKPAVNISISIAIHSLIESCQASHGLRHDDYRQYHGYCTRRLSRLRHNRAVKKELVHSAKYVENKKSARKHAFCPRDFPSAIQHENMLLSLLLGSERAWAHSCEIRALDGTQKRKAGLTAQNEKARSSSGKIRQHSLKRLKRAKQLATELEQVVSKEFTEHNTVDEKTFLESQAYGGWMRGNYSMEINDWKTAFEEYAKAMTICRKLSQGLAGDNNNTLELRDLFTARADNVLKPLLRYCQYELQSSGESVEVPPELLHEEPQETATTTTNTQGDIHFRGHDIAIENKNLRVLLLKVEGLVADLAKTQTKEDKDDKFLALLTSYDDAIGIVTADLKKYQSMKSGPAVNAKRFEMESLMGYVKFEKLKLLMSRNEALVNALREEEKTTAVVVNDKRMEEIAHLYDALLQDARAVCTLPGGIASEGEDPTAAVEDDFVLDANANVLRIRSYRCYYASRLYYCLDKVQESKSLLKQASLLRSRAIEEIAACEDMDHADDYLEALEDLGKDIAVAMIRVDTAVYLSKNRAPLAKNTNRPLMERLDDLDAGMGSHKGIVDTTIHPPVRPLPLTCKPVFFDIAGRHVPTPHVEDVDIHIEALQAEQKRKESKGLLGWFST